MATVIEKDCTTGELIEREETEQEIADRELAAEAWLEAKRIEEQEAADKAALKASADAKLSAFYESIGLTPEEIAAKLA